MAFYRELSYKDVANSLAQAESERQRKEQERLAALQAHAQPTTTVQEPQQKGGLEGFLGGLGQTIGNVGTSIAGLIGGGAAGIADLATGNTAKTISKDELQKLYNETGARGYLDLMNKAANDGKVHYTGDLGYDPNTGEVRGYELANEGKNQDAFKKMLYGTKDDGSTPNYAKAAGQALDAAATVSNFIPGANGGASMAKALGFNALQGAASGFGQAYADTGGNLESALKAAAAGGAAGAATGRLNKGLNNAIAKGGKLANFATSKPLASTIVRGGLSGAVGGAVGGGTAAGLNGGDVLTGATQGAISGAKGGAIAAPVMYGANKLTSKIPGIGGAQAALNEMEQDYQTAKQNGQRYYGFGNDNKAETAPGSLKDTYIAGDIIEAPGKIVNGVKGFADKTYTKAINKNAINRLADGIKQGADGNIKFARMNQTVFDEINSIRAQNGLDPLTKRQVTAYKNAVNKNLNNRVNEGLSAKEVAEIAFNSLTSENATAIPGYYENQVAISKPGMKNDYDSSVIGLAKDGGTSLKSIEPRTENQIELFKKQGQQKNGPISQPGFSLADNSQPTSNSILPQEGENVNRATLTSLNPSDDGVFEEYNPQLRASAVLGDNMTTYANTAGISPDEEITVYRGVPKGVKSINAGDYITTNKQLAQDYAGNGEVISMKVKASDILDDLNEPLGEEYIYRPTAQATKASQDNNTDTNSNPGLVYGESELAGRTAAQNRGNMLQRLGEVMEGAQSNTTRVQNRKLGIKSAGNAIDKVYKKTGISDLDVQTELAKELTGGANSYLDEIQRTALSATEDGTQRTVDTSPIVAKIEPLVDDKISETNLSGSKRQQFISSLKRDVQKGDTITAANRLKEQAQVLLDKKENMKPLDKQQAKVYRELAQDLDDLSYSAVPKDNVDAMFETAISESRGRAAQAKKVGNQQIATAYEKIASGLEELPRTIQAFRSFKKDFVDVAKMGELSAQGEQAVLAQNGANITGNLKRFVNKTLQKPTNQALAWAGSKISDAGEKMASSAPTAPNAGQTTETLPGTMLPVDRLANAIGRAEGARAAGNSLEAQLANMNTNEALQATQNGLNGEYYAGADVYGNTAMPTTYNAGYNTQANAGTDMLNRLQRAMELAIEAGDGTAVSQLMSMYTDLAKIYQTEEPKQTKLTATQQRANAAASSLQRLANMPYDPGYTLSGIPILGNIATARGNSYLSEAQSLAQQIGYMVSGANIKKEEAESIGKAYVPQPFDSEQIRNEKLQRAAEIIAMYQNGYAEE